MLYNLLLGLNIAYEFVRPMQVWLLLLVLAWLVLTVLVARSPATQWKKMIPATALVGAGAMVISFFMFLAIEGAGMGDLAYFLDWVFLLGSSLAAAVVVALIAWPVLAWLGGRSGAR